jgi:DNA-binding transcriptional ArsR family regulator
MRKLQKTDVQKKREERFQRRTSSPIRSIALTVVMFSNADDDENKNARLRIEDLLDKFQRLEGMAKADSRYKGSVVETHKSGIIRYEHRSPSFQLRQEIDRFLAKYPPPYARTAAPLKQRRTLYDYETREAEVAYGLLALYEAGLIDRLRRCDCKQNMYFARSNQKRCSAACGRKKLQDTPHFKTYRALYAQEQYWTAKARDLLFRIKNFSRSREDQSTKSQHETRYKAALQKAAAARRKRDKPNGEAK